MPQYRRVKWSPVPKSLVAFLFGGGAVLAYQIHCLNRHFETLVSDKAVEGEHLKSASYIAIPQSVGEAEIQGMLSKVLNVEQMMETLMKGPGFLGHDSNPWRLLRILKSQLHVKEHPSALKTLATTDYNVGLSQQIAQACDFKLSVKLARTKGVNQNLFLQSPSYTTSANEPIEDVLSLILSKIPTSHQHTCATYFFSIAQQITEKDKDEEYILRWDPDTARIINPKNIVQIIELYLQALLELSRTHECSSIMVQNGLLLALWRVVHAFKENNGLQALCVNIIANISLFPQLHLQIFQSGWIGQLAEYLGTDHASISLAAGKALANMDQSNRKHGIYDRSIYLLSPLHESEDYSRITRKTFPTRLSKPQQNFTKWDIDVIFIHGLLGGVGWTWRQSELLGVNGGYSECWPKDWLPEDTNGLRILGVDYATTLSHWKSRCPDDARRSSITTRADQVLLSLKLAGVGRRPIVWVGHSMGGLLLKQLLVNASKSEDHELQMIVRNSKALMMLSVPHGGSSVATLKQPVRFLLLPSVEVEELRKGSNILDTLNMEFKNLLAQHPLAIVSLVETKPTVVQPWGEFKFVESNSADILSCGEVHFIPLDHFEICKPLNRNSFVYQRLIKLILGVRDGSPPKDLIVRST